MHKGKHAFVAPPTEIQGSFVTEASLGDHHVQGPRVTVCPLQRYLTLYGKTGEGWQVFGEQGKKILVFYSFGHRLCHFLSEICSTRKLQRQVNFQNLLSEEPQMPALYVTVSCLTCEPTSLKAIVLSIRAGFWLKTGQPDLKE